MIDILENSNNISQLKWIKISNDAAVKINELEPEEILENNLFKSR